MIVVKEVCPKCKTRLSNGQKMYSNGICPYCGNDNRGTVCATEKIIHRHTLMSPWWRIWNREIKIELIEN